MSLFTKLLKKSISDYLRKRKRWAIGILAVIGMLIGLDLVMNHYIEKVVGTLIREVVHDKSNGFYTIDFDEIAYILNEGRLRVNELKFEISPDFKDQLDLGNLPQQYVYRANIPRLHIDIIEFWSIFFRRKLRVIGIEIGSPDIRILNLNKNKAPKRISFEAENLYGVISEHLTELKINNLKISDGNLLYETYQGPDYDNFNIKGVTFEVKNFQVNEESNLRSDKFFYTDDISLEIKDQLLLLKDSIHQITFDKFYISTLNNELEFENFHLSRRDTTLIHKKELDHYEVSVPVLRLSGIDFLSAYNDNFLTIDSIELGDPTINIKKRSEGVRGQSKKNRFKLMDVLMLYHDQIMINHFNLRDANLIFTDESQNQPIKYSIDQISAFMKNIKIDTFRNPKYKYGFDFERADLVIKDYEVTLPDSMNTVKFDEFTISSNPFQISIKNLMIHPDVSVPSTTEKTRMYADFPYILVSGFDFAKAINKDTFLIKELYVQEPDIKLFPSTKAKTENQKIVPGGFFGLYEALQRHTKLFVLEQFNVMNGKFKFGNPSDDLKNKISLNDINLTIENIVVDSATNTDDDLLGTANLNLSLKNSKVSLATGTVDVGNFRLNSMDKSLNINRVNYILDSAKTKQKLKISLPELTITGINLNEIAFENKIAIDSLKFQDLEIFTDKIEKTSIDKGKAKDTLQLPLITIQHLIGNKSNIDIRNGGLPTFLAEGLLLNISDLTLDQSLSDNPINQFDYGKINSISLDHYDFYLTDQQHHLGAENILWNNNTSTFSMENLALIPYGNPNNEYDIRIPQITMSGIDLKKVLKGSYYDGDKILIDYPEVNLKLGAGKQKKLSGLDLGFIPLLLRNRYHGVRANSFHIHNARINIHKKVEEDSLIIKAEKLNFITKKFEIDSSSKMTPNRFLFADNVELKGDYISAYHQSNSDFFNINHYYISTREGELQFNGIYYATNTKNEHPEKGNVKLTAKNLAIQGLNFYALTQTQTLDILEITLNDAHFHNTPASENRINTASHLKGQELPTPPILFENISEILQGENLFNISSRKEITFGTSQNENGQRTDSLAIEKISPSLNTLSSIQLFAETLKGKKENPGSEKQSFALDTVILKKIYIDRMLVTDARLTIENPETQKNDLEIPDIWFLSEGITYDPVSAKDTSRIFFSQHLKAKLSNFSFILPDKLSAIRIDELILDSKDSSILARDFELIPLVSRYDFGHAKGYQSTWLEIKNKYLSFEKVDFLSLINNQTFKAQTLLISNPNLNVFRDKRLPFPEWQRRPLPQTSLRNMDFTFHIDKIMLEDGYISYQEHAEKALATGEIFFTDLNATILNLTNDTDHTSSHPYAKIGLSTKVFGKGAMKAEFLFDLMDAKNIHTYGIEVNPFDLTEFNRILIPSASVQISSGLNKKIIMSAKANEDYSYGEMKFYYEDLKIALLNRETETPKGLGNVIGSFFANTFIIKTNNPRNLFLRKGDIFFERDEKRAIFNYWTKTILSGVVSSIGATNNKKKIKKMQDENLKEIQSKKSTTQAF